MIGKIKQIIEKRKINRLLKILDMKGAFIKDYDGILREDEEIIILLGINVYYHGGTKTEEELIEKMSLSNYLLYNDPYLQKEGLRQYRRATTWFVQSKGFRERILGFYFNHLLPFSNRYSTFEINRLYRKFRKKYN